MPAGISLLHLDIQATHLNLQHKLGLLPELTFFVLFYF